MKKLLKVALIGLALGASAAVASTTLEGKETAVVGICCSECEPGSPCERFCWRDC